ncbi:MAG: tetratricopeptide repeat protein, partial [Planctomycetes bacterium]|nr:tetratricopeptide repeat protein [Planctomycetota bacterium]
MKKVYAAATVLILGFAFLAMAAEPVPRPAGTADQQFQKLAQRYHQVLSQRPRKGTALDLLYRHYLDAGKLDELVAHYERRVREEPKDAGAQIILGLICERRGRFQQALEAFGRAAKLAPDDYYPDYAAAQLLVRLHQDEQAIAAFQRALGKKPERNDLIQTLKTLGRVHLHQGDRDSALEAWERLADTFPEDAIALQELAELLAQEELFDEAIRRYQQLARLAKGDLYRQLLAHIEIGEIQVRQGKLQTAIQTFGRCLDQVKPNSWLAADIRRRIEAIFVRADDRVGLVAYYRKRLKAHPDDLESMVRLAAALAQLGQTDAALEQYRSAIKVAPSRADLREKLIDELTRQKDYPAAIDEAQRLVKREPNNVDYLERLGRLYLDSGQPDPDTAADQALQVWKRIAEVRPEDPLAAVRVAELCREAAGIGSRSTGNATSNLYQSQSQTPLGEAALKYYAEAVSRAPDLPQYREYYGEYLFTIGRDDEAVAAWRQIAEAPRDTVENLKRVAQILSNVDRLPEAVQTAQQAIQKDPDRYDLHKLAADLLTQQEQYDAALKQVAEMERLADAPFLLEQTLQQRVAIYRAADRVAEEMAKLDQALRSGTASVRDAWLAAMLASAERRPAEALAHINQALKKKPDDALLLQFKAEIHQQGGDLAGAAEQYRRLAQIDPKQRTRHLTQVVNLELELGRLEAAVKTAEQIVRLTPGNAETAQLLANVYFRSGQDSNGLDVLRAALQANPRDREMRLLLARRLTERRQIDEAIEHLWRAFELSEARDDKLAVVAELAQQYGIAGRTEELIARLEQLRRSQENPVGTTLYLVEAYTQSEDYVSARRELNALLARRPADAQVLGQLVSLSERLGDTEAALRYQQKLVALSRTPQMLDRLARLYEKAGDPDRAQAIWLEMVHKTKDETAVLLAVDRAMINAQYGQVFAMAEPRWAERPDDWRFGCRLTMAYWYAKRRETACRVARAILALPPSSKYQKDAAAKRQTRAVSVLQSYSPILMRVVWPMQLRASLASSRPLRFGRSGWQPRSLLDAQLLAAMILYESARLENKDQQYVEELRRRASSDLQALRQLVWIHLSERKLEGLEPLLEQWVAQSPEDPEPRLVRFMVPFVSAGGPAGLGDKVQHLATMKTTYEWLVAHRPALARAVSVPYVHALASAGRKDEAAS